MHNQPPDRYSLPPKQDIQKTYDRQAQHASKLSDKAIAYILARSLDVITNKRLEYELEQRGLEI